MWRVIVKNFVFWDKDQKILHVGEVVFVPKPSFPKPNQVILLPAQNQTVTKDWKRTSAV